MRKSFLVFVFLSAAHSVLHAASPRVKFDEVNFDFGVLIQGATVQHSFSFENAGRAPLEILEVNASCGCTAALATDKIVPPDGKSRIDVTYDSRGKMGVVGKSVRVHTNDPKTPVTFLNMTGTVVASKHPEMTGGQNLFQGSCKTCHADGGAGKKGEALFQADCALCHGHVLPDGKMTAPSLENLTRMTSKGLKEVIAEGKPDSSMPAFHKSRGGPLSDAQIKSLVNYIRKYEKKMKKEKK